MAANGLGLSFDTEANGTTLSGFNGTGSSGQRCPGDGAGVGVATIDTAIFRSGKGSCKLTTGVSVRPMQVNTDINATGGVLLFYFYLSSDFTIAAKGALAAPVSGNILRIAMNTDRSLVVQRFSGGAWVDVGSASAIPALQTWHRVEFAWQAQTSTTAKAAARLNNVEFLPLQTGLTTGAAAAGSQNDDFAITNPGNAGSVYVDDYIMSGDGGTGGSVAPGAGLTMDMGVNTVWSVSHRVVTFAPTSDNQRGSWTGGAGGTTNLFECLNNFPPIGTASETDSTQIENADTTPDNATDEYRGGFGTLVSRCAFDFNAGDRLISMGILINHGEDASPGTKTMSMNFDQTVPGVSASSFTVGTDAGALGTYPSTWTWDFFYFGRAGGIWVGLSPSLTPTTTIIGSLRKTDTGNRVVSVDAFFLQAAIVKWDLSPAPPAPASRLLHLLRR